jgi:hypothetical protein
MVVNVNASGERQRYRTYQIPSAINAANVPGAPGKNPEPNPVEIIT